ncbi:MAG TPA: 6,7-dimethyl-8-ribityllumazine synthase [Gammaproteobacteria bacterium]|nr:6,7-dimethyl-8-ribityllumazine synthase [Gammaproteobacteria bacterium]
MSDDNPFRYSEGLTAANYRFGIVAARFNDSFVAKLLEGALERLQRAQAGKDQFDVVRVPGALEIPLLCQKLAQTGRYDALIALGCVIRGETAHFDYVCSESARGVLDVSLKFGLPVINGILTVDTEQQAAARSGMGKDGNNKGADAASCALEMLAVIHHPPVKAP